MQCPHQTAWSDLRRLALISSGAAAGAADLAGDGDSDNEASCSQEDDDMADALLALQVVNGPPGDNGSPQVSAAEPIHQDGDDSDSA